MNTGAAKLPRIRPFVRRRAVFLALGVLCSALNASAQGPSYTSDSVVNASDYSPGPFAPNSVLSIFGSNLSRITQGLAADQIVANTLPTQLGDIGVYVDNMPAPLLYVSSGQVNFVIPSNQIAGKVSVRVVRQGVTGPNVNIMLKEAAPALFPSADGYAAATDFTSGNNAVTADAPAAPGDVIVLYASGLGRTEPNPLPGEIPKYAALMETPGLQVLLNGQSLDPKTVFYAGVTPGFAGLYQVNFFLPADCGTDPEIQLSVDDQTSGSGIKLAVH